MTEKHEKDIALRDGTTIHVRPLVSADQQRLIEFWGRVSEEARRLGFVRPLVMGPREARRFFSYGPERVRALVATLGHGDRERIVGIARYKRHEGEGRSAELGALV